MKFLTEEYFEALRNIVIQYVINNYDYCYLDAMHERNKKLGAKTIIVGSSHAMNGVVEKQLTDTINFSVSSQDLYFDFLHIKKAVEEGKQKIEKCIINIGYYMIYQDLSQSTNLRELLTNIYAPLFGDTHHYVPDNIVDLWGMCQYDTNVYSKELIQSLCREWARGFFNEEPSYYGSLKTRKR